MGVGDTQLDVARNLALLGFGALLACAWSLLRAAYAEGPRASGPVALWVADRDGQQIVGLDRALYPVRSITLASPTALAERRDGGAWVTTAAGRTPRGAHSVARLSAAGHVAAQATIGVPIDLESIDRRDALLVVASPAGSTRLLRVLEAGDVVVLLERDELTAAAGRGARVLCGDAHGRVTSLATTPTGRVRIELEVELSGPVEDLAPGPRGRTWWALVGGAEPELFLLGPLLRPLWSVPTGVCAQELIPVPGEERVWLACSVRPAVRRFGPGGVVELQRFDLPLTGLDGGSAWEDEGVLVSVPGAVLHLDRNGRSAPGQGGFRFSSGIARAN
jgi:hypothetical protein